jgi:hypothetical protein
VTGIGGGILVDHADATIVDNVILFDAAGDMDGAPGPGAGIYAHDGQVIIRNNTIVANQGWSGVFLQRCGGSFDHNILAYNRDPSTGTLGYGLDCEASFATIADNLFWENPTGSAGASCGNVDATNGNVTADPKFCNVVLAPWGGSPDFGLRPDSPAAPGHEYEGRGAPLPGCVATPAQPTTWGSVKARYR